MADPTTWERTPVRQRVRYEDDLYTWVIEQVELLRAGRLNEIDAENIAEELSDVGSEQYDKLESSLRVLLMHMLKWDHQFEKRTPSWVWSIKEHRRRIERVLKKNPGLKPRIAEAVAEGYDDAIGWASLETGVHESEMPRECPYTWDEIVGRPFELDRDQ
jgi:hypothetical protein